MWMKPINKHHVRQDHKFFLTDSWVICVLAIAGTLIFGLFEQAKKKEVNIKNTTCEINAIIPIIQMENQKV